MLWGGFCVVGRLGRKKKRARGDGPARFVFFFLWGYPAEASAEERGKSFKDCLLGVSSSRNKTDVSVCYFSEFLYFRHQVLRKPSLPTSAFRLLPSDFYLSQRYKSQPHKAIEQRTNQHSEDTVSVMILLPKGW